MKNPRLVRMALPISPLRQSHLCVLSQTSLWCALLMAMRLLVPTSNLALAGSFLLLGCSEIYVHGIRFRQSLKSRLLACQATQYFIKITPAESVWMSLQGHSSECSFWLADFRSREVVGAFGNMSSADSWGMPWSVPRMSPGPLWWLSPVRQCPTCPTLPLRTPWRVWHSATDALLLLKELWLGWWGEERQL